MLICHAQLQTTSSHQAVASHALLAVFFCSHDRAEVKFIKGIALSEDCFGSATSCLLWSKSVVDKMSQWKWGSTDWTPEKRRPHMLAYLLELVYDLALDRQVSKDYSEAVGFESPLGYYVWLKKTDRNAAAQHASMQQKEEDDEYNFRY